MEVSQAVKVTQNVIASSDGRHVAAIHNNHLEIRSATTVHALRTIALPSAQSYAINWSPKCPESQISQRLLLADEEQVRVWDLLDDKWTATISNGSGGMGKIVHVEFGRTKDEVLVFSDFNSKVTVWSLQTGRTIEIRDPKFATSRSFAFRKQGGVFALLSRPGSQDLLTLHARGTYTVLRTITLPTMDAQGLKWSADGKWIAIWDASSMGQSVHIYTADGHLYRTHSGNSVDFLRGLGVRALDWCPRGEYLAIGGHDTKITLLGTRTFSPTYYLEHTPTIQLELGGQVWEEQVSAASQRTYSTVSQPVSPPTAASPLPTALAPPSGMSSVAFNWNGRMLAARHDSTPTTVWIWDFWDSNRPRAKAVLIQHSPVKSMSWHPTNGNLLLIQCTHDDPTVYLYDDEQGSAYVVPLPLLRTSGKLEAKWMHTPGDKKPAFTFGDAGGFIVAWPDGKDVIVRFDDESGNESDDSLYEALTGRSPSKSKFGDTEVLVSDILDETTEVMDDTFMGRGQMSYV